MFNEIYSKTQIYLMTIMSDFDPIKSYIVILWKFCESQLKYII